MSECCSLGCQGDFRSKGRMREIEGPLKRAKSTKEGPSDL